MRRVSVVSIGVVVLLQSVWIAALGGGAPAGAQVTPPRMMPPGQDAPKGTAVLRGTVVAADTGAPIRRAQVRAMAPDVQDNKVALTDDQGHFELRELVGGRYIVTASRTGFVTLQYGQRRPAERGTPVEVPPGQTLDKLAIALPRGGVIAGRIMDEVGEPLAEVQVQVLRSGFFPGGRRMMPMGRGDSTDDQGAFRIYGLQPGEYVVSATMRGSMGMTMMVNGRPAPDVDQGYAPTYYPGTPSMSDAQRVTVAAGQEVSGIAFGLTPTRVSRISGRVVGGPAGGSGAGFVMMMPDDPAMGFGGPGGQVQPDGTFEISGVPPGRYVLQTQPRGPRDGDTLVGVVTVTVAGVDLAGIVIPLQRPGTLRGVFEFEGGIPAGLQASQVRLQPMPAEPMSRMFMTSQPETASDFTFSMRGGMAPVFVRVGAPPGWYLHSVLHNGEDITDTPVPLGPGVDVRDVRVRLTQTVSTVSGSVRDDRGQLVLDATVLVFPADDTKWGFGSRFVRTTRPDTQGRFEVRSLPAYANYRIIALQGLEDGQMFDPDFLSGIRDRAERLTLNQGEAKALDLRLRQ